jgi:4-amino-4-deoxy-L-arabinose transferase-like glycosyltransferase
VAIWLAFTVRAFFYSAILPLWEGYDEYGHFAFLQHLLATPTLPRTTDPISSEVEQSLRLAPLPFELRSLAAPYVTHEAYWRLPAEERAQRQASLAGLHQVPAASGSGEFRLHEAQQPPLYYWLSAPLLKLLGHASLPARLLLLRWASVLLASLVIPLGFLLCRHVLSSEAAAVAVVAVIAVMPEMTLDVARVANDGLAVPLFTLLAYATVAFLDHPERRGRAWLLGLVLGAGLLTKAYFVAALPPLILLLAWTVLRKGSRRATVVVNVALAVLLAGAVSGWWFWRNHELTGAWLGESSATVKGVSWLFLLGQAAGTEWLRVADAIFVSHIWCGGWSFLGVRSWMYHFYEYAALAACLGLVLFAARLFRAAGQERAGIRRGHFLALLGLYVFFWLGLGYHALANLVNYGLAATAGWYLYCLVAPELVLAAWGLGALAAPSWRRWILPAAAASFALLDLYATHFVLLPYYTGLIRHHPGGGLEAFHLSQLAQAGVREFLARLLVNKPLFLSVPLLAAMWACFIGATVAAVVLCFTVSAAQSEGRGDRS